ncbi:MAG TPA: M48 family metallopeptidase, partial [Rhizobiales bacterium]|nr:M48 family metallopeptidase [Hyphomicrobiales bacterium]
HHVRLRLTEAGLEITPDTGQGLLWPYAQLRSSAPIYPGGDVLISLAQEPDARLHVNHPEFAGKLLEFVPDLSRKAARRRLFIPLFLATLAILFALGYLWVSKTNFSQIIARMIPESTWNILGEKIIDSMAVGHKVCRDSAGEAALLQLVKRLNRGSNRRDFKVRVIDLSVINAFATPGENIVISNKLIQFVKSPDEVAGVLAHEMGHGIENHPEAGLIRSLGISAAMSIILGGSSNNIASLGSLLLQMSYSRDAEREADRHALEILRDSAIDAQPLADFFRRMEKRTGVKGSQFARKALSLMGSHPAVQERVTNIENTPAWPSKPALTPAQWKALQQICE